MKPGSKKTNGRHPGISLVNDHNGDRNTLQWIDPVTTKKDRDRHPGLTIPQLQKLAEAKSKWLQVYRARIASGDHVPVAKSVDLIAEWVSSRDSSVESLRGRRRLEPMLRKLEEQAIYGPIQDLKREHLSRLRRDVSGLRTAKGKSLKINSQNQYLKLFMAAFRTWSAAGLLKHALDVEAIRYELRAFPVSGSGEQTKHSQALTPNELQKGFRLLLEKGRPEFAAFYSVAFLTGLRREELSDGSMWQFIHKEGGRNHMRVFATKTGQSRNVTMELTPMATRLLDAVAEWKEPSEDAWGGAPKTFAKSASDFERKHIRPDIGERFNLHSMRASCGSYLMILGMEDTQIARRLGHTTGEALSSYRENSELIEPLEGMTLCDASGCNEVFQDIIDALESSCAR
jgi:integrase